jgi:mycothiol synthase
MTRIHEMAGEQGLTGYRGRAAIAGDLDAIVRLSWAYDASLGLPPSPTREFLQSIWRLPATDLGRDTRIIERDQVVAGFAQAIWQKERGGPLDLLVFVHPDQQGNGIATSLLSWGESLARQRGAEGVRAEVPETDLAGHVLLRSRGYHQVRSAFTMAKPLGEHESARQDPDGVTIRPYVEGDEQALFEVHEASFADHWGFRPTTFEAFGEELHAFGLDPSLVFLAEAKVGVVGHIVSFLDENEGFVGMLGVIPNWRGRGIAKALLRRTFEEISTRDRTQVKLQVDAQNPHGAVALYESVGMIVERQLDIFELGTSESAVCATN